MAEGLAREDVADVNLDRGPAAALDRVAQRVAGVAQRARVDDDAVVVELLDPVDERAFVVGLEVVERGAAAGGVVGGPLYDFGERRVAVDLGLALAQPAEVRAR